MNTWEEKLEQIEKELSELDTNITKAQKNLEKTNTELVEIEKAATTFTEHKKVQSLKEEITFLEKMIEDLKSKILEAVERYLKSHEKVPQKRLDLISKVELKEELGIGDKTLIKWEGAGLPQYIPPIEDTRKAYYKISDVLKFLGVDDGKD